MPSRTRVRPGRGASLLGLIGGLIFIGLGVLVIIPMFGAFGILWTLVAAAIAVFYGYNLLSERGASLYEIEIDTPGDGSGNDFDARLRKLARLRADGLITEAEYEQKRAEIMAQRW